MTTADWLRRAKNLHKASVLRQRGGNGSVKCSKAQANEMNALQGAIGSHHAPKQVTFNELRSSLDDMLTWVKSGDKTVN